MAFLSMSYWAVNRLSAAHKNSNETVWFDFQIHCRDGSTDVTLFPEIAGDPRFAALAEFIAATWPEEVKPVESAPAVDETDLPF